MNKKQFIIAVVALGLIFAWAMSSLSNNTTSSSDSVQVQSQKQDTSSSKETTKDIGGGPGDMPPPGAM